MKVKLDEIGVTVQYGAINPSMSDDGRYIAFTSRGGWDLENPYWKDMDTGRLVMVAMGADGQLNGKTTAVELSPDGLTAYFDVSPFGEAPTSYV